MSKIMNDNFQINVGNPIDAKYLASTNAPYVSTTAVNSAIAESQRYVGLTVNINNIEYWYETGVGDADLVVKDSGLASTGITNASNGLTKVGNAVILGGTLTGNTKIDTGGNYGLVIGQSDNISTGNDTFVAGGYSNSITNADTSGIIGGYCNTIDYAGHSGVFGGYYNSILGTSGDNSWASAILGGTHNCIGADAFGETIVSGFNNIIGSGGTYNSIVGGSYNTICDGEFGGVIIASRCAVMNTGGLGYNSIIGGYNNTLASGNSCTVIIGGENMTVTDLPNHAIVPSLAIWTAPTGGTASDDILVWDSTSKKVKKVSQGAVGITTAINGLSVDGTNFVLGGALTGDTIIDVDGDKSISICTTDNLGFGVLNDGLANSAVLGDLTLTNGHICVSTSDSIDIYANATNGMTIEDGSILVTTDGDIQIATDSGVTICNVPATYFGDYSSQFTARSIPDAEWVTGITSGGVTSATNGLTKTGQVVCLGGTLSVDTVLTLGAQDLYFTGTDACLRLVQGTSNVITNAVKNGTNTGTITNTASASGANISLTSRDTTDGECSVFNVCEDMITLTYFGTGGTCQLVQMREAGMFVTDNINQQGFVYGGDYESNWNNCSLVTKEYVDGAAGAINAANGLTRVDNNIILGGALTGVTTISGTDQLCVTAPFNTQCAQNIVFDETPNPDSYVEGRLYYKNNTLNLDREYSGVTLQIGEETVIKVENISTVGMTNGQAVYINGATGGFPTVALSQADAEATASDTIGLLTQDIANNGEGYVTVRGVVRGVNTGAYSAGDVLWLSTSVAGGWTATMPEYPNQAIKIGTVTKVDTTDGEIFVNAVWYQNHVAISDFNTYTGATDTLIGTKLPTTTFSTYTGATKTTLDTITPLANAAITGVTNGLTKVGSHSAKLGGALTEATTISGAQIFTVGTGANICLTTTDINDIALNAKSNGAIYLKSQSGTAASSSDMTDAIGIAIDYNASVPMLITDNSVACAGLQYASDYTSNYTDRSLVSKYYVDSIATGLNVHAAVAAASEVNLTLSGDSGTVDGIAVSAITATNNRILVRSQTNAALNGIYSASTGTWGRTADYNFDPSGEVSNGDLIPVISGDTEANSQWILVTQNPIVSGNTLTYSLFSQQQGIVEGDGICVTTSGANKEVAVKLSPSNSGLCFDATALEIDYGTFSSGLTTAVAGKVSVCASTTPAVGDEIAVRFAVGDGSLIVDKGDFSYTTASNGLTKVDTNVTLGGTLTGDTSIDGAAGLYDLCLNNLSSFNVEFNNDSIITDSNNVGGLKYAGDYRTNFTDLSLVDKYFVNNAITGSTLTYTNGLTKLGSDICWGGSMSADASLQNSNSSFCVKSTGIDVISDCACILTTSSAINVRTCTNGSCDASIGLTNTGTMALVANNATQGITITSAAHGAVYVADYSSVFVDNSLVSKKYTDACDAKVSGATLTAANSYADACVATTITGATVGLTKTGQDVGLGDSAIPQTSIIQLSGVGAVGSEIIMGFNSSTPQLQNLRMSYTQGDFYSGTFYRNNGVLSMTSSSGLTEKSVCLDYSKALEYTADYSADFTVRSLVDKDYVDTCVGNVPTGTVTSVAALTIGTAGTDITSTVADSTTTPVISLCIPDASTSARGALTSTDWDTFNAKTTCTGTVTSANNGLSATSTTVSLGGALTGDTVINTADAYGLAIGSGSIASGNNSFAIGNTNCAVGNNSFAGGYNNVKVEADTSFAFALGGGYGGTTCIASGADNSAILGGNLQLIINGSQDSAILGGSSNEISTTTGGKAAIVGGFSNCVYSSYSAIIGGNTNALLSGNTCSVILGGDNISVPADTLPNHAIVPSLAIWDSPSAGAGVDELLVWNSTDKKVKKVAGSTLNVTANNGLTATGNNVVLGGALTGVTTVNADGNDISICTSGNLGFGIKHDLSHVTILGDVTQTGAYVSVGDSNNIEMQANATNGVYVNSAGIRLISSDSVCITTTPAVGATSNAVLVWNSTDKKIKQLDATSLGEDNNVYDMAIVTTDVTLTTGSSYVQLVNNPTSGVTVTLPASPIDGQVFRVKDAAGTALTYPITIARNGNLIDSGTNDGILNTDGGALELVYNNTLGWFVFSFVN